MPNSAAYMSASRRFAFGRNWARFLDGLNDERIALAEASLVRLTGLESLAGGTLLDAAAAAVCSAWPCAGSEHASSRLTMTPTALRARNRYATGSKRIPLKF